MLISAVQQSDSVIHIYILFYILFHYGLSQDVEYSSLYYTVGPAVIQSIFNSLHVLTPNSQSIPDPTPLATTSLFSMSVSLKQSHFNVCLIFSIHVTNFILLNTGHCL